MTTTIALAEALRTEIIDALDDLVDIVTLDGSAIKPQTRAAVVILAPKIQFPTFGERDTQFTIAAVAGPPDRPLAAWQTLDEIIDALEAAGLNLATAEPGSFALAGATRLPAYEITLNPTA